MHADAAEAIAVAGQGAEPDRSESLQAGLGPEGGSKTEVSGLV